VDMAPDGLGLQGVLIRRDKIAQAVHHMGEHVGGHNTVAQQSVDRKLSSTVECHLVWL
jgi:hypothetical protein